MGRRLLGSTFAGVLLAAGLLGLALSCQHPSDRATPNPIPSTQASNVSPAPSQPAKNWAQLGFTFPSAPDRAHKREDAEVATMNRACVACHTASDASSMHMENVGLGCVDCHGGNWNRPQIPDHVARDDSRYDHFKRLTHVFPTRHPELWTSSANPQNLFTASLQEDVNFIRFVNPGDLRAARAACATCHQDEVDKVKRSMMTHGAMLWEAALYNNGVVRRKNAVFGEEYTTNPKDPATAVEARLFADPAPSVMQMLTHGTLPTLWPLPRWEITLPGNVLRVFERGGNIRPMTGIPDPEEDPGHPDVKLSVRGFGTDVRTDPVFIGLQKTRLLDPTLNMFGTNDHPGDYRASGCSACHVLYANDRSPVHSGKIAGFGGAASDQSVDIASYGNRGESFSADPTVNPPGRAATTQPYDDPNDYSRRSRESGHPIKHQFVKQMPTSSCIVCHIHPGTNVLNSYLGFMWWDNETDGQLMYPGTQQNPTPEQQAAAARHNPESAAARGLWSDMYPGAADHLGQPAPSDFLENLRRLNPSLRHTQFADFHGHGWVFRAVFKQDRHGQMLDYAGVPADVTPENMAKGVAYQWHQPGDYPGRGVPVHLKDIHLEKGMHCVDCHFQQDAHGDGNLYGETRSAVMVTCADCHGTAERPSAVSRYKNPALRTKGEEVNDILAAAFTGNAATSTGTREQWIDRNRRVLDQHFDIDNNDRLVQISALDPKVKWPVVQTVDTIKPDSWWSADKDTDKQSARRARFAHTVRVDNKTWGMTPSAEDKSTRPELALAHSNTSMSCYACHSSWNTSCFGCHLPQRANQRTPMLHNEGTITRNYTNYNYQTLRDDVYMLGVDSTVEGHKVVPIRSACAVMVSSQNANRDWIYSQQQTISAEGYAGTSFTPYFPHTVRAAETKQCEDCHVSRNGDNNAIMGQLLLQGTKSVNFVGRFAWVAEGDGGLEAVTVTERDEPQAVIGSRLHELAFPDNFRQHVERGGKLVEAHEHHGQVLDVQLRGEYLYAACGRDGFVAFDVANIDNKDFSERIITAPVSPLGQRLYVRSSYATSICSPSTMALDPSRPRLPANEEGKITEIGNPAKVKEKSRPIHPLYKYLYLTDRDEGLIVIGNRDDDPVTGPGVVTLLDGNPRNNFLSRAATYNPNGLLNGARHMTLYGHYAYITCDAGMVLLDLDDPLHPRPIPTPQLDGLNHPRKVVFQFRYGFVCDDEGVKVIRINRPEHPEVVDGAFVRIPDARDIYVSRTYGYVAAGGQGLALLDLEKPESPKLVESFNANGQMNDATAVRVAMTNASMFAYVADGRNGLKVLQLTSPDDTPTYLGFSPRPQPRLIAWRPTEGPAVALSEGLDRDRAVDESGNQLAVFGRRGARPFTLEEQRHLWIHPTDHSPYDVLNDPWTKPLAPPAPEPPPTVTEPPTPPATPPTKPRFPGRRPK
jgi:hypothetical protein